MPVPPEQKAVERMAHKTVVQLIDDLDGTTSDTVRTVEFGLDGVTYEIDLNDDHANQLRGYLAEFIASARRAGRLRRGTARQPNGAVHSREESQVIREWARRSGFAISKWGRIPKAVSAAFEAGADESRTRETR